jgi:class 3 adenylate cyclase/TolB-like protein/tetratricopeptide (TPR) repeat protein
MNLAGTSVLEPYGPRVLRTLLVADIVESVRLYESDEIGIVAHWIEILSQIKSNIVPAFDGRFVTNLGDGVLLEFQQAASAVGAAFAIQQACRRNNIGRPANSHIMLRIGIEIGDVLIVQHDVFGHGVNLAARLGTLAGPGEIVVSAHVREQLTPMLDADIEDLGECYLKHIQNPVRAYRIGPPGPRPVLEAGFALNDLRPAIAVVPFATQDLSPEHQLIGDVLAEEIIRELSRSSDLDVISRLSTAPFRNRGLLATEINAHLHAQYVLSGSYVVEGTAIRLHIELAEAKSGRIIWADLVEEEVADLVRGEREMVAGIVADLHQAMMVRELQRARSQALPTLKSYTLMMAAVALMHRLSIRDFEEARHLLESVIDRGRRQALPQAWLAHWFVLRWQQGWSPDPRQDAYRALECSKQALDADPDCSLALAIDGLVQTHFLKRLDVARARYCLAVEKNPNDSLAWLLKGTMHAFMGEGTPAVEDTQRALKLSPLDPRRYYYDSLAGTACMAAGDYAQALRHAHRSLKANRTHTSTLRVIAIAQWRLDLFDDARATVRKLLQMEPTLTISRYLDRSPAAAFETGRDWADALHHAGLPN